MIRLSYFFVILCVAFIFCSCSKTEEGAIGVKHNAAPSFILSDFKNNKVSLDDYRNKVIMLEFFASWCVPCQVSAIETKSVYEKYKDRGFVVLAISLDKGPEAVDTVGSFVKDYELPYPALMDDGRTSSLYKVISIPTSFIIDKQGNIRSRHLGLLPDFRNQISREIEALL